MKKRDLFEELMLGVQEMAIHRQGLSGEHRSSGCDRTANPLDLDPTLSVIAPRSARRSTVVTCNSSRIDQEAGRND